MGFAGNLSTLSLVEVFQTINRIRASGVLRLASDEIGRDVVFGEGEILGVAFRAGEERQALLRRLILAGKIDAATAAAISSSGKDSETVVQALIEKGLVSADDVQEAVARQAEDELYNLCTWEYADFVFQDASPNDGEVTQLVARFKAKPLRININSLLMESARRMDEWARLRKSIPDASAVSGAAQGKDQELLHASTEYPGSAVVPLIDAVRTVDDIVRDSVATRLDVYGVLLDLINHSLVTWLSRDEIIAHAEYLVGQKDFIRSAHLYRLAVAASPSDHATVEKLADCLEQLGSVPEATGCFSQLALGYLDEGLSEKAVFAARRAVSLAEADPRQRLTLVRCLLEHGDNDQAVAELHIVAGRYLELGQLQDARGTCLKILELDPKNEDARRGMARIFASAEKDPESEDVVVCVQCGHVNHREATGCEECQAPLRLTCQSCKRTVAASDRLCIFCGANPNAGGVRQALGNPATSRIVNPDNVQSEAQKKGSNFWKNKISEGMTKARALEQKGDFAAALSAWREVAEVNINNPELMHHIRELEERLNISFAEQMIDRGHQLRRNRHFWSALKAYSAAMRTMPVDDPRTPRLKEILASTRHHHLRAAAVYSAALALIAVFGFLVTRPLLVLHGFRSTLAETLIEVQQSELGAPAVVLRNLAEANAAVAQLEETAKRLGKSKAAEQARADLADLESQLDLVRSRLGEKSLLATQKVIDQGDIPGATQQLAAFRATFGADFMSARVHGLEERIALAKSSSESLDEQRREAPAKLAEAQAKEQAGALGVALASYRQLAKLAHPTASPAAQAGIARLEPKEKAVIAALARVDATMGNDLAKADAELSSLAEAAEIWLQHDAFDHRKAAIAERMKSAGAAYQHLGTSPTRQAIEAFIAAYPAAPQATQARVRLDQLNQGERLRGEQVASYRAALAGKRYDQAWQLARDLLASGPVPEDVQVPLVIESAPAGAEVRVDAELRGRSPCVLLFAPGDKRALMVSAPGWLPVSRPVAEALAEWRWQVGLVKQPRWQVELGKPITMLTTSADGGLIALSGEVLNQLDSKGKVLWHSSVAGGDDLADAARFRLAHVPLAIPDGRLALGLPEKDLLLLDRQGAVGQRLPSTAPVRGQPALYTNDILGGHPRLAFAAEALYVGDLGAEMTRLPLPSPALSGPISLVKDLDRMLVIATIQGQFVAFEESTRKRLWDFDLKAAEIGQLIPAGNDLVVTVLDGSRLACYQLTPTGAAARWTQSLGAPAVGDPVVVGNTIYLAAGSGIVRIGLNGVVAPPLILPAPATSPVAIAGELAVAGCRNGALVVFQRGVLAWTNACASPPTAVACTSDAVVVGLANGILASYPP